MIFFVMDKINKNCSKDVKVVRKLIRLILWFFNYDVIFINFILCIFFKSI